MSEVKILKCDGPGCDTKVEAAAWRAPSWRWVRHRVNGAGDASPAAEEEWHFCGLACERKHAAARLGLFEPAPEFAKRDGAPAPQGAGGPYR